MLLAIVLALVLCGCSWQSPTQSSTVSTVQIIIQFQSNTCSGETKIYANGALIDFLWMNSTDTLTVPDGAQLHAALHLSGCGSGPLDTIASPNLVWRIP
jgi:hypothetical protein